MTDARERAEQVLARWLADAGVEHEPGARPGEQVVVLPGRSKLRTTVSVLVGQRSLSASAFVIRAPDENHEAFHRWLLRRNLRHPGLGFALDAAGDVFLVTRLPLAAVDDAELDGLFGALLEAADSAFDPLLALGFRSSMEREWQWRVSRGESTANLEAFRHLLEPASPRRIEPDAADPGAAGRAEPPPGD